MTSRNYGMILLGFILAATIVLNGSSPVLADQCVAQLGYSSLSTTQYYYNSNIAITVPVSATCSFVGNQLYAVGNAYDRSANRNVGSVSTALTTNTGNTFTGQLVFNLPSSILGDQLQITVSIYGGYPYGYYGYGGNGTPLARAAQLLRVNSNNYQYGNGYNYQSNNCYQNPYCYNRGYYNVDCYQNSYCYNPGSFNGNYYTTCQSTGNSNTVQCSGYLYQPSTGCVELAIPIDNGYWFETRVYQYYTLQNLPSSYTPGWRWVTVTGQLYHGYNLAQNGALCPGNYIIVNSISP